MRKEFELLLEICVISEVDLEVFKLVLLEYVVGVEEIEILLVMLFKVMIKIDFMMGNSEGRRSEDGSSVD